MELRALLPPGVGLLPVVSWLLFAVLVTHLSLRVAYAIAARTRRAGDGAHWTETARRAWPVRMVHPGALLVPVACTVTAVSTVGPVSLASPRVVGVLTFLASYLTAIALAGRMERRLLGFDAAGAGWWRRVAVSWLVRTPHLLVVGLIVLSMPATLDARAAVLFALGAIALFRSSQGDGVRLARALGLLRRSAKLDAIVGEVAGRMAVPAPAAFVLPSLHHEAYALPSSRTVLFSDRALEELSDEELAAICAHETGHILEPARVVAQRSGAFVFLLPLAGARALIGSLGLGPFAFFVVLLLVFAFAQRGWSRRLEQKADATATAHQSDPGDYARALLRMYQANVVPAVLPGQGGTHPHLYDRLVAAGVTPEWPRPAPPSRTRGLVAVIAAVLLAVASWTSLAVARALARVPDAPQGRRALLLIALTGGNAAELSDLALARFRDARYAEAAELYRAAAALEPRRSVHRANLALTLARLGRCGEVDEIAEELPAPAARAAVASCH